MNSLGFSKDSDSWLFLVWMSYPGTKTMNLIKKDILDLTISILDFLFEGSIYSPIFLELSAYLLLGLRISFDGPQALYHHWVIIKYVFYLSNKSGIDMMPKGSNIIVWEFRSMVDLLINRLRGNWFLNNFRIFVYRSY